MSVLEMKNVSFKYPKASAYIIRKMNHSFDKGSITSITGASGSGKSTILLLLAALDNKYTGEILFNGAELKKLNQNIYRSVNVGIIFQSYNLLFQSSAIDNVKMGLYLSKTKDVKNAKAAELLEKVGITADKYKRKCLHLSGGEQQRVAIARALAGSPDLIIADEPTGNLDEVNQNAVMDIFRRLSREDNKCVIIATHSAQIAECSDYTINLNLV